MEIINWLKDAVLLENIAHLVTIIGAVVGGAIVLFTKAIPWVVTKLQSSKLQTLLGGSSFPVHVIENALRYYVVPECQDIDPARAEEPRRAGGGLAEFCCFLSEEGG